MGIPKANQVRPEQVRILSVNVRGHDWSGFVQLGRSHLNHGIVGCRTIQVDPLSSMIACGQFLIGFAQVVFGFHVSLGRVKCTQVESLMTTLVRSL